MSPTLRLSAYERVVVGARISRTADATPRPGDLLGQSEAVGTGRGDVAVVIDGIQP
jgi:cytochrome c-type biogenesis protein CcmH